MRLTGRPLARIDNFLPTDAHQSFSYSSPEEGRPVHRFVSFLSYQREKLSELCLKLEVESRSPFV